MVARKKIRAISTTKLELFGEVTVPKVTLASANVYNCFSKKVAMLNE